MIQFKYLRYPQYNWVKSIQLIVDQYQLTDHAHWVDLPAGDGIMSYWLHRSYPDQQILAIDLDPHKILTLKNIKGIETITEDIFKFRFRSDQKVWFFINSLFLLPDPGRIFSQQEHLPEYLIVVTPNLRSANYQYFSKRFPDFNMSAMDQQSTHNFFAKFGYELKHSEAVTQMAYFKWFRFPGLKYFFNLLFVLFEPRRPLKKTGGYFLGLYHKV